MYNSEEMADTEKRILKQLMSDDEYNHEFCINLEWLVEEARERGGRDSIHDMWGAYGKVMRDIGGELFDSLALIDMYSPEIDIVTKKLIEEKYADKLIQLVLGANNLLIIIRDTDYYQYATRLKSLAQKIKNTTMTYANANSAGVKKDFIDIVDSTYHDALDIVDLHTREPVERKEFEEEKIQSRENLSNYFFDFLEKQLHPGRYYIKKFFRTVFGFFKPNR